MYHCPQCDKCPKCGEPHNPQNEIRRDDEIEWVDDEIARVDDEIEAILNIIDPSDEENEKLERLQKQLNDLIGRRVRRQQFLNMSN